MRIEESQNASDVRPLLDAWEKIVHGERFGLEVTAAATEEDLQARLEMGDGALLLAYDGVELVGFFAVFAAKSSVSEQAIAVETFWFALPNRKMAGPALYRAAKDWGKSHGCTHLIVSGSHLASSQHDKVCSFCEAVGMQPFETSFIGRL